MKRRQGGTMGKFSIMEVLEQAVQTEQLGYEFYTSMSSRFERTEELSKLFQILAQKELTHKDRFQELKEITGETEPDNWEEAASYLRAIVESEFFLGKGKSLPSLEHITDAGDAVRFAMGFEKETILYFVGLRDVVQNSEIVDEIISEEKSHIKWLAAFGRDMIK
jgi:rubrerythrin